MIAKTIRGSFRVVAFNKQLECRCLELFPECHDKIQLIPPAAFIDSSLLQSSPPSSLNLCSLFHVPEDSHIFLLPCGLRPVKDPLYLMEAMNRWNEEEGKGKVFLAVVGPCLPEYSQFGAESISAIQQSPGSSLSLVSFCFATQ